MATCNINELLAEVAGAQGLTSGQRRIVLAKLLYDISGETASVLDVLSSASCFLCLTQAQLKLIQAQLLCNISGGGGGGGGYEPPAATGDIPNDSFEDYTSGEDLEGLNGGENGQTPFVILWESDWVSEPWLSVIAETVPLSPDELTGLQVWSKADQITGASNNDNLNQWDDVSGNTRHFTAVGAQRPTYQTNIQNGLPAVFFVQVAGVGMTGAYTRNAGDLSVMVVFKATGTSTARRRTVQGANDWLIGPYGRIPRVVFNDNQFYNLYQDSTTDCHVAILTQTATGPATRIFMDGAEGGAGTLAQSWPGLISLGATGGFNDPFGGHIMEIAIYDRVLTDLEALALSMAMITKWGI